MNREGYVLVYERSQSCLGNDVLAVLHQDIAQALEQFFGSNAGGRFPIE